VQAWSLLTHKAEEVLDRWSAQQVHDLIRRYDLLHLILLSRRGLDQPINSIVRAYAEGLTPADLRKRAILLDLVNRLLLFRGQGVLDGTALLVGEANPPRD